MVFVLGATPFILPCVPPFRRSGITPFFIAVHCAYENGMIAFGLFAADTVVALCSSVNVERCDALQPASIVAPFRILEFQNEYEPDCVCGAYFLMRLPAGA